MEVAFVRRVLPRIIVHQPSRKELWRSARSVGLMTIVLVGAVGMLVPFAWMLSSSLKTSADVFLVPIEWIPYEFHLENYVVAITTEMPFGTFMLNSAYIAMMVVIGSVLSSSLVAFGFARLQAPGRNLLFIVLLSTLMLPGEVTLVSTYLIFKAFGWLDTYNPLIVPAYFGNPFYIFLLRQFFLTLPLELDDAVRIDGGGLLDIYGRIVLPLSKPALATVAAFSFLSSWNSFQAPTIYLNTMAKYTVQVGLNSYMAKQSETPWNLLMAASLIAVLPCIVVFLLAQREFIRGAVMSGLKG